MINFGAVPSDVQVEPRTNKVVLVYYIKFVGLSVAETMVESWVDQGRDGSIACLVMIRPASPGISFRTQKEKKEEKLRCEKSHFNAAVMFKKGFFKKFSDKRGATGKAMTYLFFIYDCCKQFLSGLLHQCSHMYT